MEKFLLCLTYKTKSLRRQLLVETNNFDWRQSSCSAHLVHCVKAGWIIFKNDLETAPVNINDIEILLLDQANGLGHDFGQTRKIGFMWRRTENERRAEKSNTASGTENTAMLP